VLATYGEQFYAGRPVITENRHAKGRAFYVGSNGGLPLWRELLANVTRQLGIAAALPSPLPEGVIAQRREGSAGRFLFLLNFLNRNQTVDTGPMSHVCMETGETVSGPVVMFPYGSRVLRQTEPEE
jgi:beta-galactosidase